MKATKKSQSKEPKSIEPEKATTVEKVEKVKKTETVELKEEQTVKSILAKNANLKQSTTINPKKVVRERDHSTKTKDSDDSSDEEILIRTGEIPRRYYDEYEHAGYNINASKVIKKEKNDAVEEFLDNAKNKNYWRTVFDEMNNRSLVLSDKDLELINRIRKGFIANKDVGEREYFEDDIQKQIHPMSNHLRTKRSFEPSKYEIKKINRIIKAYKDGFIKFDEDEKKEEKKDFLYDIWTGESTDPNSYYPGKGYPAPKRNLPDTEESYNAPEELIEKYKEQGIILKKFDPLRKIEKYEKLIDENFERCSDLYLSARVIHQKSDIKEEDILPNLPKPEDLKPFPSMENYTFIGHDAAINCLYIEKSGNYLISGDIAGNLFFWDVTTTKIIRKIDLPDKIQSIHYNEAIKLVSVCCKESIYFILAPFISKTEEKETREILETTILKNMREKIIEESKEDLWFSWKIPKPESQKTKNNIIFYYKLKPDQGVLESIIWHNKGDYFSTLLKSGLGQTKVTVYSLSKLTHQSPFSKVKGQINVISFHPNKPYFIVATNSNIFVYNLQKQELVRKFISTLNTISALAVHKNGEHLIAGAKDGKVAWFQIDLSEKAFKTLDYHGDKVKSIHFHNTYPLFVSSSRNGKIVVYHSTVYDDLIQDPLIVPLKTLKSAHTQNGLNDLIFHPKHPWVFSCGTDKVISLWT